MYGVHPVEKKIYVSKFPFICRSRDCNLREDKVVHGKCSRWCNIDSLFSKSRHIKWNSTLPLCFKEKCVHNLKCNHVIIHLHCNFFADLILLVSVSFISVHIPIIHYMHKQWSKENGMVGQSCEDLHKVSVQNWPPIVIKETVALCSLRRQFR